MMRLIVLIAVLFTIGVSLPGCTDNTESEAQEMGFDTNRREAKGEKRPPPGPGGSGAFEQGDAGQVPDEPPPSPPDE